MATTGHRLDKLICSFRSDLINEIDFAMQVAAALANAEDFTWSKDYPLVDAICMSLHAFVCVCDDTANCYCYIRFWHKILSRHRDNVNIQFATIHPDMDQAFLDLSKLQDHDLEQHNKIHKRIKNAAELIRQFSMTAVQKEEQSNYNFYQIKKKKPRASLSLLKFVSLLLHSDDASFNLIALDILSNTATKLAKIPDTNTNPATAKLTQMFQEYCVEAISKQDGDIYIVNRSLEVVSKLISSSSRRVNQGIIDLITEKNLVTRLEQFLTSHHDVSLFLTALEFCYRISRHQPHLLVAGRTRYLMKILVNLLNCDDTHFFTQSALKRIKLVDEGEAVNGALTQSPLSVSVRITAALVLRNLAKQFPDIKQALENYEPLLIEICMTNGRDESKIIAECLSLFHGDQS